MFDHYTDSKGKVHTITISYTVSGKKPSKEKVQKDLKDALKEYGIDVFFLGLAEVERAELLPSERCDQLLTIAMKGAKS
jgi:hypothetical protein